LKSSTAVPLKLFKCWRVNRNNPLPFPIPVAAIPVFPTKVSPTRLLHVWHSGIVAFEYIRVRVDNETVESGSE